MRAAGIYLEVEVYSRKLVNTITDITVRYSVAVVSRLILRGSFWDAASCRSRRMV
jgi:hypothetical protein